MEQPVEKYYTFEDYLEWNGNERIELIDGELYMMSAPRRIHQDASQALEVQLQAFLADKTCKMYHAPFSVRLFEKEGDSKDTVDTVVEPDIVVVCDLDKLDDYGCKGAPDFIIEILSPSNFRHDKFVKLNLYQQAKVREYWTVDPQNGAVEVNLLEENGRLMLQDVYTRNDKVKVTVLPGCEIDLSTVLPEIK